MACEWLKPKRDNVPDVRELEAKGERPACSARLFHLQSGREIHLPSTDSLMSPTSTSQPASADSPPNLGRSIEQQIAFIEQLALQHYPEDERARSQYEGTLLKQRLRELMAMLTKLEVRG